MGKTTKQLTQRGISLFTAMVLLGLQTAISPAIVHATPPPPDDHKVTICHRTNSVTNPYNKITVDFDAATGALKDNGQGDHTIHTGPIFDPSANYPAPHNGDQWGDIIPSYTWGNGTYDGLNYDTAGQALLRNNCEFPKGDVKVNKKVDADGNGTYEGDNATANQIGFTWSLDGNGANAMGATVSDVFGGSHTVSENNVNGYAFTGWYSTGREGQSCTSPAGTTLPINIDVKDDKTTSITLCNQKVTGSITIVKDAQPNSSQDFAFTTSGTGLSNFSLDDDAGAPGASNTLSNTKTFKYLNAGNYTITETKVNGWTLKSLECSEGASVEKSATGVTVHLDQGQNVTCTFTNQKRGKVHVTKVTDPQDAKDEFQVTISGSGTIDGSATKTIKGGQTVDWPVDQGAYSVTEAEKSGWNNTGNTCEELSVNAEDLDVWCTITNVQEPSKITGHKFDDQNSNGVKDENESYLSGWKITLYSCDKGEHEEEESFINTSLQSRTGFQAVQECNKKVASRWTDKSGAYSFGYLRPGKYKVCEQQRDYWTQTLPATLDGCYTITICEPGTEKVADFGNHHNVSLDIKKSNDKTSSVFAGDTVTYTVNVSVPEDSDTVYDATATDVLPSGFTYISDSWTANSSVRGDIKNAPTTEPTYGSGQEGTWQLGTMQSGEVVTLTYRVKIGLDVKPGTYTNTVVSKGYDSPYCTEDGNVDREILLDTVIYCQQSPCNEVKSPEATSDVRVAAVLGESTPQVLGTQTLANTGSKWEPAQLIMPILMIAGTALLAIATRKRAIE